MKPRALLPLLGLVGGVGLAVAAPVQPTSQATPTVSDSCAACMGLTSTCSASLIATCKNLMEQRLEDHWNATPGAPRVPIMRVGGTEIPRDIRSAKYFPYGTTDVPTTSNLQSVIWPSGTLAVLPVDRVAHIDPAEAAKAHRRPSWDENDQQIKTCDEYGYEQVYDVGRFLDAANACKGDRECIFDVAFMTKTPGIAQRSLKRKDGKPMERQLSLAPNGSYPKNDMFALGARYLYANGTKAHDEASPIPRITALTNTLTTGEKYYTIGCNDCNNVNKFASEWNWHKSMRTRTADVSPAEREEYERRKAEFRELIAQHAAAAGAEENKINNAANKQERVFLLPYDMQTHDPFERYDRVSDLVRDVGQIRSRVLKKFGAGVLDKPAAAAGQQQGSLRRFAPTGVLAAPGPVPKTGGPPPPPSGAGGSKPKASKSKSTGNAPSPCLHSEWGLELDGKGPISCKIGFFLRQEWARKQAGHKSCLDAANPDCDWAPEMFTGSILDSVPSLDEHVGHRTRCNTFTTGKFSPAAPNLDAATAIIDDMEEKIGTAWQELEPYYDRQNAHGVVYKKAWAASETYGQKKYFGAKLAYDVGWNAAAAAASGGNVCELKGGLHGDVDVHAYIAGETLKVIDGNVGAQINQSSGKHQAKFKSHLIIKNEEVYRTGTEDEPWIGAQVLEDYPMARKETEHASFTYWIGGAVPVTGSMWGGLMLSFKIFADGKSPTGCDANSTKFATKGSFGPTLTAYGTGSVGLGVADIVSAGLRSTVNILQVELPLEVGLAVANLEQTPTLQFNSSLKLVLRTLSGRLSVYLEFLLYDEEWELFRWHGLGPATITLMPKLTAKLPVVGMKKRG